ncbi:hypothetical protein BC936DRAFT_139355, partial [Jimgerdemannia flammicorona]
YYRDYLVYFDAHIATHTALSTFQTHFSRLLPGCIGSSLHPLVHLALGLDFGHSYVISEALAYACIAYSSIGEMVDAQSGTKLAGTGEVDPREILEMVKVDKRFDGGFDGAFGAKLKMLAKSRGALVKVYMDEWNVDAKYPRFSNQLIPHFTLPPSSAATTSDAIAEKLHSLAHLTTLLLTATSTHTTVPSIPTTSPLSTSPNVPHFLGISPPGSPRSTTSLLSPPKLDIHLAALFSSLYAVNTILPLLPAHADKVRLLKLQWLATLCIYIVQGRPTIREDMLPEGVDIANEYANWEKCIKTVVEGNDPHAPVILRGLVKAEGKYGRRDADGIYLRAASVLADFVDREGDWDHKGARRLLSCICFIDPSFSYIPCHCTEPLCHPPPRWDWGSCTIHSPIHNRLSIRDCRVVQLVLVSQKVNLPPVPVRHSSSTLNL